MNEKSYTPNPIILKKEDSQYGQMDIIISIDSIQISFRHPQLGALDGPLDAMPQTPAGIMQTPRLRNHSGGWLAYANIGHNQTAVFPEITKDEYKEYLKIRTELKEKKSAMENQFYEHQCPGYLELLNLGEEWLNQKTYNDAAVWNQINNQDYSKVADKEKENALKAKYEAWKTDHPRAAALMKIKDAISDRKDPQAYKAQDCLLNGGSVEEAMEIYNQSKNTEPYWD